jgi:hypothetical protein
VGGEYMRYTIGDTVRFKLESGEVQEGNIKFIEKSNCEEIFYINGFNKWAYKIPGIKIVSNV